MSFTEIFRWWSFANIHRVASLDSVFKPRLSTSSKRWPEDTITFKSVRLSEVHGDWC